MTIKNGKFTVNVRIIIQFFFLFLFFFLLIKAGSSGVKSFVFTDFFFYIDPLIFLSNLFSTHSIIPIFFLSLIPVFLTLIFGRFFCGWICPLGTINQFFSWFAFKGEKNNLNPDKKLLKLKYFILLFLLVMLIIGTNLTGLFDPFSILTRSFSTTISPAIDYNVENVLKEGASEKGIISKGLKPIYNFAKKNIIKKDQRVFPGSLLIGILFLLIILANFYKRRFYCNYICPLGAMYGIIAKISIFNLKAKPDCIKCNACSKNCTYDGNPYKDYSKSECMVCFNCVTDCKPQVIESSFNTNFSRNEMFKIDPGRRRISGTILTAVFAGTLPRLTGTQKIKSSASGVSIHNFVRPPGSVNEIDFLSKCIRCGECIQACPTNFLQPALFESGIDGIWTPIINARYGYCEYECNNCTQVCPTLAIEKLTVKEKKEFVIGIAIIDKNRCYTYINGYQEKGCAVCEEHCPVPDKAIKFRDVDIKDSYGGIIPIRQIYVEPDLCIGCGICENVCPRRDAPGIIITAEDEKREQLADTLELIN